MEGSQLRAILRDSQGIDRHFLRVTMGRELEPLHQHRLDHYLKFHSSAVQQFLLRVGRRTLRHYGLNGELIGCDPTRPSGNPPKLCGRETILAVCHGDQGEDIRHNDETLRIEAHRTAATESKWHTSAASCGDSRI